ncbi:hypothetical protein DFJ73DRAFT_849959 [Zopfochytrium polystomum]|nr:hypothetical protein DFJ73DRAFT_849959 [Zopfochytrium polystomum]
MIDRFAYPGDGMSADGSYFVSHGGGKAGVGESGEWSLKKSQTCKDKGIRGLIESYRLGRPVLVIQGREYPFAPAKVFDSGAPANPRYWILGTFVVRFYWPTLAFSPDTHDWHVRFNFLFQRDGIFKSCLPEQTTNLLFRCPCCQRPSPQPYVNVNLCLHIQCPLFFRRPDGQVFDVRNAGGSLEQIYRLDFLTQRSIAIALQEATECDDDECDACHSVPFPLDSGTPACSPNVRSEDKPSEFLQTSAARCPDCCFVTVRRRLGGWQCANKCKARFLVASFSSLAPNT